MWIVPGGDAAPPRSESGPQGNRFQSPPRLSTGKAALAAGPGGRVDGKEATMTVKVGDKVITSKYAGTQVKVDGEEVTIVRQNDILAIVE